MPDRSKKSVNQLLDEINEALGRDNEILRRLLGLGPDAPKDSPPPTARPSLRVIRGGARPELLRTGTDDA